MKKSRSEPALHFYWIEGSCLDNGPKGGRSPGSAGFEAENDAKARGIARQIIRERKMKNPHLTREYTTHRTVSLR